MPDSYKDSTANGAASDTNLKASNIPVETKYIIKKIDRIQNLVQPKTCSMV